MPLSAIAGALAFEVERLRHDADRKNAHFRAIIAITGAAHRAVRRHAGGDEAHMRVGQMLDDFIARLLGAARRLPVSAGAEALRDLESHLNDAVRARGGESCASVLPEKIEPDNPERSCCSRRCSRRRHAATMMRASIP